MTASPTTAVRSLYEALGRPEIARRVRPFVGDCAMCGLHVADAGVGFDDAFAVGFGDYELLKCPESPAVCIPCAWSLGSKPPITLRLWSLVYREDRPAAPSNPKAYLHHPALHATAKDDLREVVSILVNPPECPWFVTIAVSGQKHTLPWSTLNHGSSAWSVRFEAQTVSSTPDRFARVLDHTSALFLAGVSRDEIASGRINAPSAARAGVSTLRHHWEPLRAAGNAPEIQHAAFLLSPKEHVHGHHATAAERIGAPIHDPESRRDAGHRPGVRSGDDGQRIDAANPPDRLVGACEDGAGVRGEVSAEPAPHGDAVRAEDSRRDVDRIDDGPAQLSLFA